MPTDYDQLADLFRAFEHDTLEDILYSMFVCMCVWVYDCVEYECVNISEQVCVYICVCARR